MFSLISPLLILHHSILKELNRATLTLIVQEESAATMCVLLIAHAMMETAPAPLDTSACMDPASQLCWSMEVMSADESVYDCYIY